MFNDLLHFNINGADVYVAQFDEAVQVQPVQPAARQQMIERCADPLHKQQCYCVWQLLDYALREQCGRGVDELSLTVDGNGKWRSIGDGGVSFSLSHSGNVVAVALSERAVGVDVEMVDERRFNARLAGRILTESERALYNKVAREEQPRLLTEFWTAKESVFKRDGGKAFVASAIDTTQQAVTCRKITFGKYCFVVAVAISNVTL